MEGSDLKQGIHDDGVEEKGDYQPTQPFGQDEEMEGLTLFEKKCVLINRELDSHGMGKYQWYIWGLCGFGYMLDLLWAQAFGLVLGPLQQELGFADNQSGNISTSFNAGLTAGAFVWGMLVDIIGRKWAFNLTVMISAAFGLGLGGCSTYNSFLVLTAFVGFGVGGNIPIDTTITLEFIPQNRRFLLALLSIFQPIGVVLCSAIAYGFIPVYSCTPNFASDNALESCNISGPPCCSKEDNWGWRYLLFTVGAITCFVFACRTILFRFQESPKFLVYRGKDAKAAEALQYIAKFNGRQTDITLAKFESLESEQNSMGSQEPMLGGGAKQLKLSSAQKLSLEWDRYKMLFTDFQTTRVTILIWLTYIFDYWGFTVAGFYLPTIIALKNAALNLSLKFTYRSYVYIYLPGILGVLLGGLMYQLPFFGRKWTMVVSSGLMGISIFLFSRANSTASNIGLNVMEYFFQSMFNAVLYGWTPELFPAPIRGTACGVASFWGRLFGIVSPLIAQGLYSDDNPNRVLYLAGGITLGCVLTISLLPNRSILTT